ncbi:hypothetical protein ANCCEY_01661 [Ancylostoma ceylanicum]|uniref:Major facilitator superfamily (MFS) profile domain-containing protein n=1 Tax=Ancylostoma ceylanicum TaxID=53326 RepID=A0A0D6M6V7_9BILA|nr:hypothetical protein ANCCEY_01661 [Ancylostoma ceylanicum]
MENGHRSKRHPEGPGSNVLLYNPSVSVGHSLRKQPLVICLAMTGILSLATYFVTDLIQFTAIRFVLGIFTGGHSTVVVVYLLENIPKKSRMWINTAISYSPNVIILGIIAYFFQHWRTLALVISALHIPAVALML